MSKYLIFLSVVLTAFLAKGRSEEQEIFIRKMIPKTSTVARSERFGLTPLGRVAWEVSSCLGRGGTSAPAVEPR